MPSLDVRCDGDNCWPELKDNPNLTPIMGENGKISMALLRGGMKSGQPSVAIRIDCPDGKIIVTETSLALLSQAIKIFNIHLEGRN